MLTLILAVAVAMGVSFLCSVMEAALLSINPGKLALLVQKRPHVGKLCMEFRSSVEKPIAVILILNTTAHTFGAAIAGAQFDKIFGSQYIWLFSLIFTVLMVQYTEILPKTLGVRYNLLVMSCTAVLLKYSVMALSPLIWLVHFVNRPFERGVEEVSPGSEALEEIDALAAVARKEDHITSAQEQAICRIPDLHEEPVSKLMTPAAKMVCLDADMDRESVLKAVKVSPHSRYPVRNAGSDTEFAGVVELRQLLFCADEAWQRLIHPAVMVESDCTQLHIAENLASLDSKLLLVRSPEGKILGLLTTNDLLMSLFTTRKK